MGRVCSPSPFGMCVRRTGGARYVPDFARVRSDARLSRAAPRIAPRSVRPRLARRLSAFGGEPRAASRRRCDGPRSSAAHLSVSSPVTLSARFSLRRFRSSMSLSSFPRSVPTSGAALCSAGSRRTGSPTSSLILRRSDFSSPRRRFFSLSPFGSVSEETRSPRFLGNPCASVPPSATPAESRHSRSRTGILRIECSDIAFPHGRRCRPPRSGFFRGSITRPTCSLSTLRRRPHGRPRKTRFHLATSALSGRDFNPRVANQSFCSFPHFLFGQAFLAHLPSKPHNAQAPPRRAAHRLKPRLLHHSDPTP